MDLVGQKFGKYELVERLGQGGTAEVYKAHQPGLDRYVAIKIMHHHLTRPPDFVTRFKREAKSIGQLQHPHIIHVIDFDNALAKEPAERFQTVTAFKMAIAQAQARLSTITTSPGSTDHIHTIIAPPQPTPAEETLAKSKPWLLWLLVGGGTLLVILLIAASILFQPGNVEGGEVAGGRAGGVSGDSAVGFLRFVDNDTTRTGDFSLTLAGVNNPPAGRHYSLWVTDETAANTLNLISELPVNNGQVAVEGSTGQHLLGNYSRVVITLEPDNDPDEEMSANIAYVGALPASFLEPIRQVMFQTAPRKEGLLPEAEDELRLAIQHTGFVQESLDDDNLNEARRHAEHVINILVGEEAPEFGDLDGDGQTQNPGDGVGIRSYLTNSQTQIERAVEAIPSPIAPEFLGRINDTIANNSALLEDTVKGAAKIHAADTVDEAQASATELAALLDQLLNGADLDNNGVIDPTQNEGGLLTIYEDALSMSDIAIFPAQ